jgi:DUF917 family protein
MKLPTKIMIKGKAWKVKRKRSLKLGKVKCDGLCHFSSKLIEVRSGLDDKKCMEVFMHEIIHAAVHELHLDEMGGINSSIEEVLCTGLSDIFLSIFDIKMLKI